MSVRLVVLLAVLVGVGRVAAQPAPAMGQPLASPNLPVGTVVVSVVDGSIAVPHAGIEVWLRVDDVVMQATTDDAGRATFAGLAVGATASVGISVAGASVLSHAFAVPAAGGMRVVLSALPVGSPQPPPRQSSGAPHGDDTAPPGTLAVRLTYNDLADAHPPAKLPVYLASYAADGKVAVVTRLADARGVAHFTGLDRSGAVAYYALATLPRGARADRLVAAPVLPGGTHGAQVTLSAEARTTTAPPIDELAATAVPAGKLHVTIAGPTAPGSTVRVVDAETGKELATATADTDATIAQPPARVMYVEAIVRGEHYRSRPFQPVADRGAEVTVYAYPRLLITFQIVAEPEASGISAWAQFTLQNSAWSPYANATAIPLPVGFTHAELADGAPALAVLSARGLTLARPLAPGETRVRVAFELAAAAADGKVHWNLDLPNGTYQSSFQIATDPGVAISDSALPARPLARDGLDVLQISPITIPPKHAMAMAIALPPLTPAQASVARACRPLDPDRKTALRGKPMPDFTAPGLDGKPLTLSSLRGKVIVVNFMASWAMPSTQERPTFAPLAAALGKDLEIVLVASDAVAPKLGATPPFRAVLDPPVHGNVGPITGSWGVHLLPESFVIDRHGVVRLYLSNARDWSTPDARACLAALARD